MKALILISSFLSFSLMAQCPDPSLNINQGINDLVESNGTAKCDVTNQTERNYVIDTQIKAGEEIKSSSINLKFAALNSTSCPNVTNPKDRTTNDNNFFISLII